MNKANLPRDFRQSEYDYLYPPTEPMVRGATANKEWMCRQNWLTVMLIFVYSVRDNRRRRRQRAQQLMK